MRIALKSWARQVAECQSDKGANELRVLAQTYRRQAASGYVHAHDREADLAIAVALDRVAARLERKG